MSQLYYDPDWPRASEWLAGSQGDEAAKTLGILGAPLKLGSITPGNCHLAPAAIRTALQRFSTYDVANAREVRSLGVRDFGDLDLAAMRPEDALIPLADAVSEALGAAGALAILGGDNSVTRPGIHGLSKNLDDCGLLTLDAHFDLRRLDGSLSNGNPVRALLADGLPGSRITQIGIQSFANSKRYADVAREAGITVITAEDAHARGIIPIVAEALDTLSGKVESIYVDLDLDVLDRAFSPATPGSRPGGLAPWQIRQAARLCGLHPKVRVMDIVEVDPLRDRDDATVLSAAACLLSFASGLCERWGIS